MPDETEIVTAEVTEKLNEASSAKPENKLEADKALFAKITGEEFGSPSPKVKKEKEPEVEEEEEVEAEAEPEKPADPRVVAARKGLAQAGYPASTIENATDEDALSLWNRHTEQDFDRSTAKEQALELQRRLDALEKERQTPVEPPKPLADPEPLLAALKDQLGEDVGEAIGTALKGYMQTAIDTLNERVGGLEGTWKDAEERQTKAMTAQNRSRLQDKIPQLESDTAWKAIEEVASTLIQSGKTYLTADQLFDDAAKEIYGPEIFEDVSSKAEKQKKKIRSAAPTTESRRRAPEPQSASEKQAAKDWEAFMKTEQKRKAGEYR